jgi:hypothetical protein
LTRPKQFGKWLIEWVSVERHDWKLNFYPLEKWQAPRSGPRRMAILTENNHYHQYVVIRAIIIHCDRWFRQREILVVGLILIYLVVHLDQAAKLHVGLRITNCSLDQVKFDTNS